ncbi:MAG: alpha/beta hydrolase [Lachnospiraceae bacterium]|nr:alpha/beta hydrolase [Lachnospiraceae bacterium]
MTDNTNNTGHDPVSTKEDISLRGKTARRIVKVANHMPVIGTLRVNGILQNLISEHEHKWRFPDTLKNDVVDLGKFRFELLRRNDDETRKAVRKVILQLHGGGYYGKLHNTYRAVATYYNIITNGFDVVSPDYRVAPGDPYPAALEDAVATYNWLLSQGYLSKNIIISGDSAGGGLSLCLVMYLRDHDLPLPAGIITMSAWTDLTKSGDSYSENFDSDPVFGGTKHTLVYKKGYYGDNDPQNPYISPIFGSFRDFPPMLMQVGELEMLLDDTVLAAEKAEKEGVNVISHTYPGMFHVFQLGLEAFPEAKEAWEEIRSFIEKIYENGASRTPQTGAASHGFK